MTAKSSKISLRPSQRAAVERFMDTAAIFRRSDLAKKLYPTTNPRSLMVADKLAQMALAELSDGGRIKRHGHIHWEKVIAARKLIDGRLVAELDKVVEIKISTRCPQKWLFVDGEIGAFWASDANGRLARATNEQVGLLRVKVAGIPLLDPLLDPIE